jgi:hypothetical protein
LLRPAKWWEEWVDRFCEISWNPKN